MDVISPSETLIRYTLYYSGRKSQIIPAFTTNPEFSTLIEGTEIVYTAKQIASDYSRLNINSDFFIQFNPDTREISVLSSDPALVGDYLIEINGTISEIEYETVYV